MFKSQIYIYIGVYIYIFVWIIVLFTEIAILRVRAYIQHQILQGNHAAFTYYKSSVPLFSWKKKSWIVGFGKLSEKYSKAKKSSSFLHIAHWQCNVLNRMYMPYSHTQTHSRPPHTHTHTHPRAHTHTHAHPTATHFWCANIGCVLAFATGRKNNCSNLCCFWLLVLKIATLASPNFPNDQ